MALRGKKPDVKDKRFKGLFLGPAGVGKTVVSLGFPRPYLFDTEKGAEEKEYVDLINEAQGLYLSTNVYEEIVDELLVLIEDKHPYKTLILDPVTTIHEDRIEIAERAIGDEWGKHVAKANRDWKRLANLLLRLDMNVIVTSHSKNLWVGDGNDKKVVGSTFDGPKGLDYLFDLVVEVQRQGEDCVGIIRKSRIAALPRDYVFPFSYQEIAKRYGREILERDAVPVALATDEQVAALETILETRKDGEELREKWLKKAQADNLGEIPAEAAAKIIEHFNGKDAAQSAA